MCELLLTGFSDEAAINKTADQQFSAIAALGLQYLSLRFIDVGNGIKNVMQLSDSEQDVVAEKLSEYGLQISSIGSPIGKTKLYDVDDGTNNSFFEFEDYLENHVTKACEIARRFDCRLIRGFSFYHPKGTAADEHVELTSDRLTEIAARCDSFGLTFGLEVEANLVGQSAKQLVEIHRRVSSDALVLIFDGANLATQGYNQQEIVAQFNEMKHALGWIHIKDHKIRHADPKTQYVDEESLCQFVPAGQGESGYLEILKELKLIYGELIARLKSRNIPGLFADLEPHLKGGGQFGGFSGPDGFGIATRAFCDLCEQAEITCRLREFDAIC